MQVNVSTKVCRQGCTDVLIDMLPLKVRRIFEGRLGMLELFQIFTIFMAENNI